MSEWDVAVVGGGPAGLMAATRAAERGRRTILFEKNRRPGVKILLSGGTRCNLTHATDARGIVEAYGPAGRFLHSALAGLGPQQLVAFFEAEGVATKIEPNGKIFPASDRGADILAVLERRLQQSGCSLAFGESLVEIAWEGGGFRLTTTKRTVSADKVVLTTGGQSYPACGTTGDGYRWAALLGHTIVTPRTALVPITSHAAWLGPLQGITVPDAAVQVVDPEKTKGTGPRLSPALSGQTASESRRMDQSPDHPVCPGRGGRGRRNSGILASARGSLLFTHFGVSGPVVLDVSRAVSGHARPNCLLLVCDLAPECRKEAMEAEIGSAVRSLGRRRVANLLDRWVPHRLAEAVVERAGVPGDRIVAEVSKEERRRLVEAAKGLVIPIAGTMGFRKAEVTAGGIALDEVDSRTMQSRIVPNLFFAGELLDLDGPIGGYNFQAAFSTGLLAGNSV